MVQEALPPGYKMTELGLLPEDWRVVKLGDLFDIRQGKAVSAKGRVNEFRRPFLRTANVFWGRLDLIHLDTMTFSADEVQRLMLQPEDLLVCEGGDIGRTAIWRGEIPECYYQNHLHRLRAKTPDVDPLYVMYWMQAAYKVLGLYVGTGNQTTIPNLSRSRLAEFLLPLPPLPEQRAIANVLSTVQQARERTNAVIAATRELKRSLMRHVFTYGPVPVGEIGRVKLKETEIGLVPEEWEITPIADVFDVQLGKMLSPKARRGANPTPYLRNQDVRWGRVNTTCLPVMDFDEREAQKFDLRRGDVLVCEGGGDRPYGGVGRRSKTLFLSEGDSPAPIHRRCGRTPLPRLPHDERLPGQQALRKYWDDHHYRSSASS